MLVLFIPSTAGDTILGHTGFVLGYYNRASIMFAIAAADLHVFNADADLSAIAKSTKAPALALPACSGRYNCL